MPTLAFGRVETCLLLVHSESSPADQEWDEYLKFLGAYYVAVQPARILVCTEGGGPTASQRSTLDRLSKPYYSTMKVAIITGSTFGRGLVKAFSLLHSFYRGFDPKAIDDALVYLDVPPGNVNAVKAHVARMCDALGVRMFSGD